MKWLLACSFVFHRESGLLIGHSLLLCRMLLVGIGVVASVRGTDTMSHRDFLQIASTHMW